MPQLVIDLTRRLFDLIPVLEEEKKTLLAQLSTQRGTIEELRCDCSVL